MLAQTPTAIIMIRPHRFYSNQETMRDNAFQQHSTLNTTALAKLAYLEVSIAVQRLRDAGVLVHLFEDIGVNDTPDSVFPNNWFSTHHDGKVFIYPMRCHNRQREVRQDILDFLHQDFQVSQVIDLRHFQEADQFLEGTGSIVFDHAQRIAYASLAARTCLAPLQNLCAQIDYQPYCFHSYSKENIAIYHTNVMLSIGTEFVLIGTDNIREESERTLLIKRLTESGKDIIQLSTNQIQNFAANALEVQGNNGKILALSERAFKCLTARQQQQLEQHVDLLPLSIPTIELAGGSVRCMMAGVHLPVRSN
ncbi:amidinotransferase [Undibacterium amnicola]|uniref:Amidinotransferase n=1 Tax=Undibacterium amnicola TaxID=1834038 RepID=A0ABR6XV30_9BURK|nr:arginine deiminase-related protein [Undibacterium amnicola]MBC3833336.1 amidinotransferase [Undibacterium amnicola]